MATENVKANTNLDALFTQLAEPFDPSEIKWRVTHTNRDGNRGAVIAYADPRAYTDRLDPQLPGLDGFVCDPDETGQTHPDRQGAGDLHFDDHWLRLSFGQWRRMG